MELVAPIPRGLSVRVAALLLVLSLLPQVLFIDHAVTEFVSTPESVTSAGHQEHGADDHHDGSGAGEHSIHCHGALGGCSQLPMTSGPGQLLGDSQYAVVFALAELEAPTGEVSIPPGFVAAPDDEPPRNVPLP